MSGCPETRLVLCSAVSGAVLHMQAEALSLTSGSSSFGQSVVYIANSSFTDNHANTSVLSDGSNTSVAAASSFNILQGAGGKVYVFVWCEFCLVDNDAISAPALRMPHSN